jgi:hypothetical protein
MLSDGTVVSGSIDGIEGRELVLDIAKDVGGGLFHYDERLPLAKIEAVKIYEQ